MIKRNIESELSILISEFPIIVINGPRQSGKTTLVKEYFNTYNYVNLELPTEREFAKEDPVGFLISHPSPLIIDEAQYVPELFSYIQVKVDENKKMAEFILTGSQNYLVLEKISQSLAGRVGILTLLPFSIDELQSIRPDLLTNVDLYMHMGTYPSVYDRNIRPYSFYSAYINTYVERDIRTTFNITNLSSFNKFIKLLAARTGQLLNKNEIANEAGITHSTVERWLSVLESTYIIFRLKSFHKNLNKRIVKQPKLYFYDTGLAIFLLGLRTPDEIANHYLRGGLFENMVISEFIKENYNYSKNGDFYFWRDNHKNEVDLIIQQGNDILSFEIKSAMTFKKESLKNLEYWVKNSEQPPQNSSLIYGGYTEMIFKSMKIFPWVKIKEYFVHQT